MKFTLPPLPYATDALEPYIDALTMEIHHDRHHQTYIDNLNKALEKHPELGDKSIVTLLKNLKEIPEDIREAVRNNGGGTYNHALFWQLMTPKSSETPKGQVALRISQTFGSFSGFQREFNEAAKTVFGSGWAWLVLDKEGIFKITTTANQDSPISHGLIPILGLDVWEHAYYLQYQNKRPDYIQAWWHVVNWDMVEQLYESEYV